MRTEFLNKAEANLPPIYEKIIVPDVLEKVLRCGESLVLDLGCHYVGYFSFKIGSDKEILDAPVRLRIRFCETEREITDDFSHYNGTLSASWLQEEIVNCDFSVAYSLLRRYAARYIVIEVVATRFACRLSDFKFTAVTSADENRLKAINITDGRLAAIDKVAVTTLKNCMQRVFEDGPKRDRRLWIGDLRLEALSNYYTFDNCEIVKRCLYLFAAAEPNSTGFISGYVYEYPEYRSGNWYLMDYSLLYVACICDYFNFTADTAVPHDLYEKAKSIMDAAHNAIGEHGIITVPDGCDVFIDWCEELEKTAALHGVYLYVLKMWAEVLQAINAPEYEIYNSRYERAVKAAELCLCNGKYDSVHSVVWLILGGALRGDSAGEALAQALSSAKYKPFTPYMHHYVVEALIALSKYSEADGYIKNYWGGMVDMGADTFYEVYVPNDPDFSPYNDRMINSMCHGWSCTPTYFIRKYFNKGN